MTLKQTIYNILLNNPETRDSDKKLIWEVWKRYDLIHYFEIDGYVINEYSFMKAPSPESCRRCRQALQRSDLLTGAKLIQPSPKIKKQRQILANENGFSYIVGKQPVYNPEKGVYEI